MQICLLVLILKLLPIALTLILPLKKKEKEKPFLFPYNQKLISKVLCSLLNKTLLRHCYNTERAGYKDEVVIF